MTIQTKLTTSGNSVAVRLPKELLKMSGLTSSVQLEAKHGKIIISKSTNPRHGWASKITTVATSQGKTVDNFQDMQAADQDGLDDLPWDGPTFEQWQENEKLS